MNEANNEIDILIDKIEFDQATDKDVTMLKKWKLYRISLKKLDASDINVIFPTKPELS
ncbi:tail fiber assembly protein [Gilliamella apicola]|uniref:tail fiber assembly protein n=1 Tax=Gilliamella apicola TaxID=1196095 RepID=UPI0015E8E6D7